MATCTSALTERFRAEKSEIEGELRRLASSPAPQRSNSR